MQIASAMIFDDHLLCTPFLKMIYGLFKSQSRNLLLRFNCLITSSNTVNPRSSLSAKTHSRSRYLLLSFEFL